MKRRLARSSRILLVAVLPACGGGDFTATNHRSGNSKGADAALDGSGSGGTTGDSSLPGTGNAGAGGGGNSSGGSQQTDGGIGSGGNSNAGGARGNGGADAGSPSDGGAAGDGGSAGGGAVNAGGTGSGGINGAGGSCLDPTTWYVDADQDGWGSKIAPTVKSCTQPQGHYTKVSGDCNDAERDVHPQLTLQEKKYFGSPYKTPDGADSFDYDCSGTETGDPSQPKAATCSLLMVGGACGGSGYSPNSNRGGAGLNVYCGSQKFQICKLVVATCTATSSDVSAPYACN